MGYDRNDRRYGRDQSYGYRPQGQGRDYERGYDRGEDLGYNRDRGYGSGDGDHSRGRVDYGRAPQGYDYEDRNFFERAGDEVRSWFGDEEAERRRRFGERYGAREHEQGRAREGYGRETSGRSMAYDGDSPPSAGYGFSFREQREPDRSDRDRDDRGRHHDPHYRSWRERQIEALDRDYEDYRRENQSRFETEFAGWRGKRQAQRESLNQVKEHQEVVGSDGQHVGKVDHVRGDRILLARNDADAGGHHHSIPSSWIVRVGDKVEIDRTAESAHRVWKEEENSEAMRGGSSGAGGNADRSNGPHNLNRSFPGTY